MVCVVDMVEKFLLGTPGIVSILIDSTGIKNTTQKTPLAFNTIL